MRNAEYHQASNGMGVRARQKRSIYMLGICLRFLSSVARKRCAGDDVARCSEFHLATANDSFRGMLGDQKEREIDSCIRAALSDGVSIVSCLVVLFLPFFFLLIRCYVTVPHEFNRGPQMQIRTTGTLQPNFRCEAQLSSTLPSCGSYACSALV